MAAKELLLVLVVNVLNDQKPSNVVNDGVLVLWVIEDSVLILSIVTDGVLQF